MRASMSTCMKGLHLPGIPGDTHKPGGILQIEQAYNKPRWIVLSLARLSLNAAWVNS